MEDEKLLRIFSKLGNCPIASGELEATCRGGNAGHVPNPHVGGRQEIVLIVLVVSTGLAVVGCDAVFVQSVSVAAAPTRMSGDGLWARTPQQISLIPLQPCEQRDLLLLSHASDPANPARAVKELSGFLFRPGDIDMDGQLSNADLLAYMAMAYDYNMDGRIDSGDYFDVMQAIYDAPWCE
jgi:hypothetical protein